VHTITPTLDAPDVPTIKEMPSFLKRRLARRYQDRGEPVPSYLLDEVKTSINTAMGEVI